MVTFPELCEKLAEQHDTEAICELLEITPEELVNAFQDKVEAKFTLLLNEIE